MTIFKGLTVSQPWASRIANGEKPVENRGWFTGYRGPLAIHAGQGLQYLTRQEAKNYPMAAILCVCRLSACVSIDAITTYSKRNGDDLIPGTAVSWRQIAEHKYTEGPFCWIFENVFKFAKPIPQGGAQGLWNVDEKTIALIRAAYKPEGVAK